MPLNQRLPFSWDAQPAAGSALGLQRLLAANVSCVDVFAICGQTLTVRRVFLVTLRQLRTEKKLFLILFPEACLLFISIIIVVVFIPCWCMNVVHHQILENCFPVVCQMADLHYYTLVQSSLCEVHRPRRGSVVPNPAVLNLPSVATANASGSIFMNIYNLFRIWPHLVLQDVLQ